MRYDWIALLLKEARCFLLKKEDASYQGQISLLFSSLKKPWSLSLSSQGKQYCVLIILVALS